MKNFFKGISFSQLLAGALAAVTSFLLSSKIGIAGSVIGVAVASIVSTAASQLYQNVIDASSKKLQDAAQQVGVAPSHANAHTGDHSKADIDDTQTIAPVHSDDSRGTRTVVSGTHATDASKHPQAGTKPQMTKHDKRVAVIVALISGLVAVGITAGVILALTGGKGTDSVVRDVVSPTYSQTPAEMPTQTPAPTQSGSQQSGEGSDTDSRHTKDSSTSDGNGQSTGSSSGNASTGSGTSGSDSSNPGSSGSSGSQNSNGSGTADTGSAGQDGNSGDAQNTDSGNGDSGGSGNDGTNSGTTQKKDGSQAQQ
ncbi:hypothetical protein PG2006B_0782 [Bifidobacterium animalis subsp. animalis]|uniref:hypothetical protein n=1 Tax=Bifidobacterium animalis TaxID=28025 RepID=UPI0010227252|nr:hypothetical protein [Bifidobacterium animalis]RYN14303.1 hypothetical protein PG2006B_0782 [Bifidobacterium animalis subsp. animalis]